MESALIVSCSTKSIAFLTEMLNAIPFNHMIALQTCGEARRLLLERDFDLVIIDAPLRDESGESLSRYIAAKAIGQVILIVKTEYYEDVSAATEDYGILTIAKPMNRNVFWSALKLAKSVQSKLKRMRAENERLTQKMEDIRVVNRAKCILISYLRMSEQDAHKYIEKQAMDMRMTKRAVAEGILKVYES